MHSLHPVESAMVFEYLPDLQISHSATPSLIFVLPWTHSIHRSVIDVSLTQPDGQFVQTVCCSVPYLPASHVLQATCLILSVILPSLQLSQAIAFSVFDL